MSSTARSQGVDADDEDFFFVFDEENVTYQTYKSNSSYLVQSSSEWQSYESENDQEQKPKRKVSKSRRKKQPREGDFSISNFPPFALFAEDLSPDVEEFSDSSSPQTEARNTLVSDLPFISTRHRTYRKFRFYDLIRSNVGVEDPLTLSSLPSDIILSADSDASIISIASPTYDTRSSSGKVRFNNKVKIFNFSSEDFSHRHVNQEEEALSSPPIYPTYISSPYTSPSNWSFFAFYLEPHTPEVEYRLEQFFENYQRDSRVDFSEIQKIMVLARKQSGFTADNVVSGFEALSDMGKKLLNFSNRLQALSTRIQVVSEIWKVSPNETAPVPKHTNEKKESSKSRKEKKQEKLTKSKPHAKTYGFYHAHLCECLVDCEELRTEIQRLQEVVVNSEKHMKAHVLQISTSICDSIACSKRVRSLFTMIYEQDASAREKLHAIISINSSYSKCINFLTEMNSDRIFKFWKNDFRKLSADIRNLDYLSEVLLEQTRKSLLA